MTVYPGPHNARPVVRDSDEHAMLVNAIAQTLASSAMSPSGGVKLTSADASSHSTWNRSDSVDSEGCHAQFAPSFSKGELTVPQAALTTAGCHAQFAVLRLERALAGRLICLHQHREYPPRAESPARPSNNLAQTPKVRRAPARGSFRGPALFVEEVDLTH